MVDPNPALTTEEAGPKDSAGPALAMLAWGLALLGTTLLVVTEVWLEPRPWVWPAVIAAYVGGVLAFIRLSAAAPLDPGDPPPTTSRSADPASGAGPQASDAVVYGHAGGALGTIGALRAAIRSAISRAPMRAASVALGLAVGGGAVVMLHALGDGRPSREYWGVFSIWLAGIVLYSAGLVAPDRPRIPDVRATIRTHKAAVMDGAMLLAVSLILRLTLLSRVPNILTGDEGVFGNAAEWMSRGEGAHMFGTYWANASMYFVPHAALIRLIGPSVLAIRLPGALAAAFAATATYALGRLAFGRRVGLAAGVLVAASHLHVHVSRMGLGHGLDALLSAVALWGLYRGFTQRDIRAATLGGVALGLAQYGYVGARMIDLVAVVIVVGLGVFAVMRTLFRGRRLGESLSDAVPPGPLFAAFGASLVTAGPMLRWALVRPDDYLSRLNTEGLLQSGQVEEMLGDAAGPLAIALGQTRDAALAFVGAPAVQFYFTEHPMLTVLWASLFVLGLALAVRHIGQARFWMPLAHVLVSGMVLGLASNTSTAAYRISGVLPSVAVLSAVALFLLVDAAHGLIQTVRARRTTAMMVVGLVVVFELWAYVGSFAPGCGYWGRTSAITSAAGQLVGPAGRYGAVYALARPEADLGAFESISYLTGRKVEQFATSLPLDGVSDPDAPVPERTIWDVYPGTEPPAIAASVATSPGPALILAIPDRRAELDALKAFWPEAKRGSAERCEDLVLEWIELPTDASEQSSD